MKKQLLGFAVVFAVMFAVGVVIAQTPESSVPLLGTNKVLLTMVPMDASKNASAVYSAPVWTVSNPALATVTPVAADVNATVPMSAWLEPKGATGEVIVTVTADADPTEAVRPITATQKFVIVGEATTAAIAVGVPVKR